MPSPGLWPAVPPISRSQSSCSPSHQGVDLRQSLSRAGRLPLLSIPSTGRSVFSQRLGHTQPLLSATPPEQPTHPIALLEMVFWASLQSFHGHPLVAALGIPMPLFLLLLPSASLLITPPGTKPRGSKEMKQNKNLDLLLSTPRPLPNKSIVSAKNKSQAGRAQPSLWPQP